MVNHPNRNLRIKKNLPELGWTFGQFLPEIGETMLAKMRRVLELEAELKALRQEISSEVNTNWTFDEIQHAQQTVKTLYNEATGTVYQMTPRCC